MSAFVRSIVARLTTLALAVPILCTLAQSAMPAETPLVIGNAIADALLHDQFESVTDRMAPEMLKALPAEKLRAVWQAMRSQCGEWTGTGQSKLQPGTGFDVVIVPINFARQNIDLKLTIADGRLSGLFVSPRAMSPMHWSVPDYVRPGSFRDVPLKLGLKPFELDAILNLPVATSPVPVVILVHGSGPSDLDESIGPNRPFRDLAEGLASSGIAVLRYDKRTHAYPGQFAALKTPTVKDETIDDVDAAINLAATIPEIDPKRIIVLGHSLGGTLAPRIAAGSTHVAGLVILAGAARPLPDILVEQYTYLASLGGKRGSEAQAKLPEIRQEAERALAAHPGDLGPLILGVPPSYWGDLNNYDPAATAASLSIPILALQGDRDYQVGLADLDRFRTALAAHRNAQIHVLPGLNHLFMAGTMSSTPGDYQVAGHVDRQVIDLVADFILAQPSKTRTQDFRPE